MRLMATGGMLATEALATSVPSVDEDVSITLQDTRVVDRELGCLSTVHEGGLRRLRNTVVSVVDVVPEVNA